MIIQSNRLWVNGETGQEKMTVKMRKVRMSPAVKTNHSKTNKRNRGQQKAALSLYQG